MRNHAKINGVVFVRGQTAFISKKLLESLMKEMAAPMVSIDIGTTADGGVGGVLLRTDKMEESVNDHEVERKALEESVQPLADVPMDSHHFLRIREILEKADPICVVLGISLPPLEKGKHLYYPKPKKDGAVESSHDKKKPRVQSEGMVREWVVKKKVIPHESEPPGYEDHFNDVARYLSKLCKLPAMRFMLRLASRIASNVRLPNNNRLSWRRNYAHAGKDNNYGADDVIQRPMLSELITNKDLNVIKESFLASGARFVKQALNPLCNPDEHAVAYRLLLAVKAKLDPKDIDVGLHLAVDAVAEILRCRARASTFEEISQDNGKSKSEVEFFNFMKLKWRPVSSYFTNQKAEDCVLENPFLLIHENMILSKNIVEQAIAQADSRPLLIFAEDVEDKLIGSLILGKTRLQNKVCIVKAHEDCEQERTKVIMHDLAILTGGQVVISDDEMVILGGAGSQSAIEERHSQLRSAIELSTSGYEVKLLKQRLHYLSNTAAVFKVGPCKLPDKLNGARLTLEAVKRTMDQKIGPGAGIALLHVSKELDKLQSANVGANISIKLFQHALKVPVFTIASSAGFDGSFVVKKLLEQDNFDLGYDPIKCEYVDVMKSGICDPVETLIYELYHIASRVGSGCWACHYHREELKLYPNKWTTGHCNPINH
ncbi:Chaperonin CPN60-1 [Citrus sinensis]|uniref:Chaperonin CPN60-1 n=1 Tax=Citrus sinensis TaxID=2711 RepID=A0ACB8MFI9_CITSI|nr:Chaperonin CPN60-1 [Citrus sinensis]